MTAFNIEGFRISEQQKRLWLLLQQNRKHYFQMMLCLKGRIEQAILVKAVKHVFNRHEILRTSFCRVPDVKFPLQVIAEEAPLFWVEEDISTCSSDEQSICLAEIRQREVTLLSTNLEEPVWRIILVKCSPLQHALLFTLSPLCVDKISCDNLYCEITQQYQAMLQNKAPQEEEVVQYVQYAEWQHDIQSEESSLGTTHWEQFLAQRGENPRLSFKQLKNRQGRNMPELFVCSLPDKLRERIETLAQRNTLPISQVLLACWMILLRRLSGSNYVKVECFCDGRTDEALSLSIGPFARFLPVGIQMGAQVPFMEILRQVSFTTEQIYQWQDYCLATQQQGTDAGGAYFYEYGAKPSPYITTDLTFSVDQLAASAEPVKLKLSCYQAASKILIEWAYDSCAFMESDIKRIASYFETLICSACDAPQTPIEALELQSQHDSDLLVQALNRQYDPSIEDSPDCVQKLFEIQTTYAPQQRALLYKETEITYAELNIQANQLARYLQTLNVGPEVRVGIYMDRSIEMVIGLLAVLKAGGVYVPLDPAYPQERLEMILQDADVHIVVLQNQRDASAFAPNMRKVILDRDRWRIEQQDRANLNTDVWPDNLAYIVYTSSTTGRAKGVAISHSSLCVYIRALHRQIEVDASDIYAHTASFAFSSSMRQLLLPLSHGATVFIASTEQRKNPIALFDAFRAQSITVWDVVPTFWQSVLQVLTPDQITGNALRLIVSASEALKTNLVHHWKRAYKGKPSPNIVNMYGQTETAGIVSLYPLSDEEESDTTVVPLGKPTACVRLYILDHSLLPAPAYIPGNVYIGGMSLARGYLNQPELTAERFIPDKFGNRAGARLYNTGDVAYSTGDGFVEFVGREDYQVKLRGIRIMPGEIEAALSMYPDVQDAVVLGHEEHAGEIRLIAYIVPKAGKEPSSGNLQAFLRDRLPDFMIPSTFLLLEALPLTSTGKIDRQALPPVNFSRPKLTNIYTAPQTESEKRLVQIWEQVLGITPIGIDDDFFELGGHSLQAVRLVFVIQQTFQIDFSLAHFLSAPRIVNQANVINKQLVQQERSTDVSLLVADLEQLAEDELQELLHEVDISETEA